MLNSGGHEGHGKFKASQGSVERLYLKTHSRKTLLTCATRSQQVNTLHKELDVEGRRLSVSHPRSDHTKHHVQRSQEQPTCSKNCGCSSFQYENSSPWDESG